MPMEWTVFTALAAIVGLGVTVGAPIIRLNANITRLTTLLQAVEQRLQAVEQDMDAQRAKATESHRRLWTKSDEQDKRLNDHETRIRLLEGEG